MEIRIDVDGTKAVVTPVGKLTVQTAPELDAAIEGLDANIMELEINLSELDYISSAGLRVLVSTQKMMTTRGGTMTLMSPNDDVYEVFDMTGLAEVLTIVR
ncbi:MAG: STAS domain-containing protein [Atopobiaceae bacterium]|nr:STAS domain-containing protein [Atopobiaceae bacterium]